MIYEMPKYYLMNTYSTFYNIIIIVILIISVSLVTKILYVLIYPSTILMNAYIQFCALFSYNCIKSLIVKGTLNFLHYQNGFSWIG